MLGWETIGGKDEGGSCWLILAVGLNGGSPRNSRLKNKTEIRHAKRRYFHGRGICHPIMQMR